MSEFPVKVEDISQVKKKMSFEIPWVVMQDELESVYRTIGKKAKIKGFRPGKIPRKILENYYKADAEEETITNIVNKYYWQELDERGIVTLSRPEIEQDGLKENTNFSFSASLICFLIFAKLAKSFTLINCFFMFTLFYLLLKISDKSSDGFSSGVFLLTNFVELIMFIVSPTLSNLREFAGVATIDNDAKISFFINI